MKGFFGNGRVLLKKEGGEVHVTHKTGECYDKWSLVKKAEKEGLVLRQKVAFCKEDYPGYGNKRADGSQSDAPFHLGDCTTFVFVKKPNQS